MFSRLSSRFRQLALGALALIALTVAGCGSSPSKKGASALSTSGATTGSTTTLTDAGATTSSPSPRALVQSATDEVRTLLALGKPGTTVSSQGTVSGWAPANGSAIPADPSHISGFGFVPDKAKGIQYLAFAVKDTSGRCAGGDLVANASGTRTTGGKPIKVPAKAPCTGDEVARLAGRLP